MRFFALPHRYLLGIVVIVCGIPYIRTMNVPWYFDDFECISRNPLIRDFSNYFTEHMVIQGTVLEDTMNIFKTRPLSFLSFSLNYYFNGAEVFGYHLVNIAIHMINAVLVYLLVVNIYPIDRLRNNGDKSDVDVDGFKTMAFFASCLFAAHPIMTNAVTYITQRMTSLASLFYLTTMVAYQSFLLCNGMRYKKAALYAVSLLSCCAAMLTKEIAFTLPAMVFAFDMIFCPSPIRVRLARLVPFIATMAIIPYNVIGLKNSEALQTAETVTTALNLVNFSGTSSHDYLATQLRVLVFYIRKLVLPTGLSLEHDFPLSRSFLEIEVVGALLVHLSMAGYAVALLGSSRKRGRHDGTCMRAAGFGVCWFYVALSVESTVVPLTEVAVEHRLYLPAVGLFLFVVCTVHRVLNARFPRMAPARSEVWVLGPVALLLMAATITRNEVWRDPVGFWCRTIEQYPLLCRPYANLADHLVEKKRYEEAREVYRDAIEVIPNADVLHYELGRLYIQAGDYARAADEFVAAIQLAPDRTRGYYGLAQTFAFMGDYDRVDAVLNDIREMD